MVEPKAAVSIQQTLPNSVRHFKIKNKGIFLQAKKSDSQTPDPEAVKAGGVCWVFECF